LGPHAPPGVQRCGWFVALSRSFKRKYCMWVRKLLRRTALLWIEAVVDGILGMLIRSSGTGTRDVILPCAGAGSLGDEAMMRAAIAHAAERPVVLVGSPGDLLRPLDEYDADVVVLPGLVYGNLAQHVRAAVVFSRIMRTAATFGVIGADTMDGAYSRRASVRRFRVARLAAGWGVASRIYGFSWNAAPDHSTLRAMLRASRSVLLLFRDPISFERAKSAGASGARLVADLAFLTAPDEALPAACQRFVDVERAAGRKILVVNQNGGITRWYPEQAVAYVRMVQHALARGYAVVLVPHDSRPGVSDIDAHAALVSSLDSLEHVFLVDSLPTPGEVVAIGSQADFAVTGRMHFAIVSSIANLPSIALSYQGKLQGLYELFEIEGVVSNAEALGDEMIAAFDRFDETSPELRRRLAAVRPRIEALALGNFEARESAA
jgi:colanic acid/amylovoran biosynthesis protein